MNNYLADIDLPTLKTQDFWDAIPAQRSFIENLLSAGTLVMHTVSDDLNRLWVIVRAETESEARSIIARFPIIDFVNINITPLRFTQIRNKPKLPTLFMN